MLRVSELVEDHAALLAWLDSLGVWASMGMAAPQASSARVETTPLTGGLMNHLWSVRVEFGEGERLPAIVIKQALDALRVAPNVRLDVSRIVKERDALCWFSETLGELDAGRGGWRLGVPRVHAFCEASHALVMEHVPALCDLDGWRAPLPDVEDVLATLGHAIACVHGVSASSPHAARWRVQFAQPEVQRVREMVQYRAIHTWLEEARHVVSIEPSSLARVRVEMEHVSEVFSRPGACLTMGDLWLRAVLLEPPARRASLIDWEFVHWGSPAQDVGHLLAHVWMKGEVLDVPDWSRRTARAFLETYFTTLAQHGSKASLWNSEVRRSTILHASAEILARVLGPFRVLDIYEDARGRKKKRALRKAVSMIDGVYNAAGDTGTHDCLLAWM